MNKQGNTYTFLYASIMVVVVAAVLAFASTSLKPIQDKNAETAKKMDILKSVGIQSDASTAEDLYSKHIIASKVINMQGEEVKGEAFDVDLSEEVTKPAVKRAYPLFICKLPNGEQKTIIPLRGTGLWGPIWGYISLNENNSTVFGATFGDEGETPGLGAEIAEAPFQEQFKQGKSIFDENGKFTSISVLKGGKGTGNPHAVDAISGGTITSKATQKMIKDCLSGYLVYFKKK